MFGQLPSRIFEPKWALVFVCFSFLSLHCFSFWLRALTSDQPKLFDVLWYTVITDDD